MKRRLSGLRLFELEHVLEQEERPCRNIPCCNYRTLAGRRFRTSLDAGGDKSPAEEAFVEGTRRLPCDGKIV